MKSAVLMMALVTFIFTSSAHGFYAGAHGYGMMGGGIGCETEYGPYTSEVLEETDEIKVSIAELNDLIREYKSDLREYRNVKSDRDAIKHFVNSKYEDFVLKHLEKRFNCCGPAQQNDESFSVGFNFYEPAFDFLDFPLSPQPLMTPRQTRMPAAEGCQRELTAKLGRAPTPQEIADCESCALGDATAADCVQALPQSTAPAATEPRAAESPTESSPGSFRPDPAVGSIDEGRFQTTPGVPGRRTRIDVRPVAGASGDVGGTETAAAPTTESPSVPGAGEGSAVRGGTGGVGPASTTSAASETCDPIKGCSSGSAGGVADADNHCHTNKIAEAASWRNKEFCDNGGYIKQEFCKYIVDKSKVDSDTSYKRFDEISEDSCAERLNSYRDEYEQMQALENMLEAAERERDDLRRALRDARRDMRRAMREDRRELTEAGGCIECVWDKSGYRPREKQGSTWKNILGLTLGLGAAAGMGYLGYKGFQHAVNQNKRIGWPTPPGAALGFAYPFAMAGLYGGLTAGLGGGGFGCASTLGGISPLLLGGFPAAMMGMPAFGGALMPGMMMGGFAGGFAGGFGPFGPMGPIYGGGWPMGGFAGGFGGGFMGGFGMPMMMGGFGGGFGMPMAGMGGGFGMPMMMGGFGGGFGMPMAGMGGGFGMPMGGMMGGMGMQYQMQMLQAQMQQQRMMMQMYQQQQANTMARYRVISSLQMEMQSLQWRLQQAYMGINTPGLGVGIGGRFGFGAGPSPGPGFGPPGFGGPGLPPPRGGGFPFNRGPNPGYGYPR